MTPEFKQEFTSFLTAVSLNNELVINAMTPEEVFERAVAEGMDQVEAKLKAPEIIQTAKARLANLEQFTSVYLDYLLKSEKMSQQELEVLLSKIKSDYLVNKYMAYQQTFLIENQCKTPDELVEKLQQSQEPTPSK